MSENKVVNKGIVKQVLSGDTIVVRGQPRGGPPPEKTICLSNITAPKLERRPIGTAEQTEDEPFAWEARDLLRKKVIGKEVLFTIEYKTPGGREYGTVYLGKDITTAENLTETLVNEGYVSVRDNQREQTKLNDLEETAKQALKGKWGPDAQQHIREVKWTVENPRTFVDKMGGRPIDAVVEHVRDGSTIRAFLLPDFYHVTVMISGIRCPMFKLGEDNTITDKELFAEESKYFTECRLLHRNVQIILETVNNNNNFVGSVIHPNGNIAEALLKEGFARCVDWTMSCVTGGPEKLRSAERLAKQKKLRLWKDWAPVDPKISDKEKEFVGKVCEIVNGDALVIKKADNTNKKIFLSSIRPPRLADENKAVEQSKSKNFRPLYDIPWMFEAREFLRKKLIGKKVNVVVDYIQPASNMFPEKTCCTVTAAGINVAEALVAKGYAKVVRYRQDDDQRSSHYDELLAAEMKAIKSGNGLHNTKDTPSLKVADTSGDYAKSKQFLPFLQRAGQCDAVVEFVASGSRVRLYVPKETCLITFLLSGINCPRASRPAPGGGGNMLEGEPWGEEALIFTKELCLHTEVKIEIETMDRGGNFIGWMWVDGKNLSLSLVEEGLASVHFTAERSPYYRQMQMAEEEAKTKKLKMWSTYVEIKKDPLEENAEAERKENYQLAVITEVTQTLTFYAQKNEDGAKLETLMTQMRDELKRNPPLSGAYMPKKGDTCAAKFSDGAWYRAKIEKATSKEVSVLYIDYGNRATIPPSDVARLPMPYSASPPYAQEYGVALVQLPKDPDLAADCVSEFLLSGVDQQLLINKEYRTGGLDFVSILIEQNKEDLAKGLIQDGLLLVEPRKEKRLQTLVKDYLSAQDQAKRQHLNIWRYGDVTEDDALEFGLGR